jgi:alpha-D-ribose 1-methylphosphonate 5-triphosphate synthase subunit PhnL
MVARLSLAGVGKTFTMHLRGGLRLPVLAGVGFDVGAGECVVLGGPSGAGKSSILKMIYGNYRLDSGSILLAGEDGATVDLAAADPRTVLRLRRRTIGYVSQFLRVVPRVGARAVVAEPLLAEGVPAAEALDRAGGLLARLNLPPPLWDLPPATFSGGEQQRVNIARGFIIPHAVLLLDEPTASLDRANRLVVVDLVRAAKAAGAAIVGIFHDGEVRDAVADRVVDVSGFAGAPAG